MRVAAPIANIGLSLQHCDNTSQKLRVEAGSHRDPAPIPQLHPQHRITARRRD
jgi:hypothetical protein